MNRKHNTFLAQSTRLNQQLHNACRDFCEKTRHFRTKSKKNIVFLTILYHHTPLHSITPSLTSLPRSGAKSFPKLIITLKYFHPITLGNLFLILIPTLETGSSSPFLTQKPFFGVFGVKSFAVYKISIIF